MNGDITDCLPDIQVVEKLEEDDLIIEALSCKRLFVAHQK